LEKIILEEVFMYLFGRILQLLRYFFVLTVFTAILIFSGCCGLDQLEKAHTANSVQEAASVHVGVLSITPWEEYVDALQPQFPITPITALTLALPQTSITQNSLAEVLSGGLQVGLPQSSQTSALTQALTNGLSTNTGTTNNVGTAINNGNTASSGITSSNGTTANNSSATNNATSNNNGSSSTTSTTTTNGNQTTTQTTTTQSGAGALPPNLLPNAALPNAAAAIAPTGTIQLDPLLTYTAATAIYQEIQLLNTYVKNAALRHGYVPYLVRIRVDVSPLAKNQPYDTYVDIGFFSRCGNAEAPVIAIPLLVSDDVETGRRTDSRNIANQLALSLGGIVSNVALQAGLSDLKNRFKSVIGNDFNSLYMVSRGTDNVIQVRLGAATNPNLNVGYSMQAQTHNVSLLLLVNHKYSPNECKYPQDEQIELSKGTKSESDEFKCNSQGEQTDPSKGTKSEPEIWFTSYVRLRDVVTGEELAINRDIGKDRARKIMERFMDEAQISNFFQRNSEGSSPYDLVKIAMLQNDVKAFNRAICCSIEGVCRKPGNKFPMIEALWTSLTTIIDMSEYGAASFNMPMKELPKINEKQVVLIHDNCKDTITTTLGGFGSSLPSQFTATLTLPGNISVESTSITQAVSGGPFTIKFPSLKPIPLNNNKLKKYCDNSDESVAEKLAGSALTMKPVTITTDRWANGKIDLERSLDNIYYIGVKNVIPKIKLFAATDTITTAADGTGTLRLFITADKPLTNIILSFSGASLALVPNNATQVEANGSAASLNVAVASNPNTVLDIKLQNLVPTRVLTITATGQENKNQVDGSASVIALPIISASSKSP
jgi:hypothetical protein